MDIFIIDDDTLEENQTFAVTLTTLDPDGILGTDTTVITVVDNDGLFFYTLL